MLPGLGFISKAITGIRNRPDQADADALAALGPPERMQTTLERERARADRTGQMFSVITFSPQTPEAERQTPVRLAKILQNRLRFIDEIGWLDERQVGVVLPATGPEGAWKVVEDVVTGFPKDCPAPLCTVYTYPSGQGQGQARSVPATGSNEDACSGVPAAQGVAALETLFLKQTPFWKRAIDVIGAAAGLVLLLPLLAAVAVAIKVSSRGPVLFAQRRGGWGGRPFLMYKFRTMVVDAEARKAALMASNEQDGPAFKIKNDPRVTRIGRFLRATSLDELPQLWNVVKGDMSLVGPRPLPYEEAEACAGWQRRRLDVTPGLTCIWQVRGRCQVSFADWVRMDLEYIRSRSLPQDLRLLLMTVPAVVLRKGAH